MAITVFPAPNRGFPANLTRVATITSSTTWTHPDGASASNPKRVYVVALGAGGGGGGGRGYFQPSTEVYTGGAGGGAGFISGTENLIFAPITITIGSGGTGGGGGSRSSEASTGNNGGTTSVGTNALDNQLRFPLVAFGGRGGLRGDRITTGEAVYGGGGFGSSQGGGRIANYHARQVMSGTSNGGLVIPELSGFGPGSGAAGAGQYGFFAANPGVNTTGPGGLGGLSLIGNGGNGGASRRESNLSYTGNPGTAGTGRGSGGGGGGAAINTNPSGLNEAIGGSGGAGAPGLVVIYY